MRASVAYEEVLSRGAEYPLAHFALGIALLRLRPILREGGTSTSGAFRVENPAFIRRDFKQPRWEGEDLTGKTILLLCRAGIRRLDSVCPVCAPCRTARVAG